jgi:hypothetical protein
VINIKTISIRFNNYIFDLLLTMKKHLGYKSINQLVNELVELGYMEKENMYNGKSKNK